jgi:hypothetical protein
MRWIIGDIHGMLRPLEALVDAIDDADPDADLIFVGDYCNRGPDAKGVLDYLCDIRDEGPCRFCRGNHDDVLDLLLNGRCYADHPVFSDPRRAFNTFTQHGLVETLESYGVAYDAIEEAVTRSDDDAIEQIFAPVPARHREFFRTLLPCVDEPDLFVAHAVWDVNVPDDAPDLLSRLNDSPWLRTPLLWGRFELPQILAPKVWRRHGFFGHTVVENYPAEVRGNGLLPVIGPNVTLLDTGCAVLRDGLLTAVCHEARELIQVDRAGNVVG